MEPRDWIFAIAILSITTSLVLFIRHWWMGRDRDR